MTQFELAFDAGLQDQFPDFMDVVRAAVYGCGRPFKALAADLDLSPSKLSRMLSENPDDPINLPLRLLPKIVEATGDKRPLYWLVEAFVEDPEQKRRRAMEELESLLPRLEALLGHAGR